MSRKRVDFDVLSDASEEPREPREPRKRARRHPRVESDTETDASVVPAVPKHHGPAEFSEPWLEPIPFQEYVGNAELTPVEREILSFSAKIQSNFWQAYEIDMANDAAHWMTLDRPTHRAVINVLTFFAGADGKVMQNAQTNFAEEFKHYLIRHFYAHQASNEAVHAETYRRQITTLLAHEPEALERALHCTTLETVVKKGEFVDRYMRTRNYDTHIVPRHQHSSYIRNLQRRLVAFACVEGIMFSSSFAIIQWLKSRNKCPGIVQANELISRDEALHCKFATFLYQNMRNKLPSHEIAKIIRDSVDIEVLFMKECVPEDLPGLNRSLLETHVQSVANNLFLAFCPTKPRLYPKVLQTELRFMKMMVLDYKDNFFEKSVTSYQSAAPSESTTAPSEDTGYEF